MPRTRTLHFAFLPLVVFAVITALPFFLALILPFLTETTEGFELFHLTLSVDLDGLIVYLINKVFPLTILTFLLLKVIFFDGTLTVTLHTAIFKPSAVVAVILAIPLPTAFTVPFLVTVATVVLLLFHIIVLFDASAGVIYAFNVTFLPLFNVTEDLLSVTPFTSPVVVSTSLIRLSIIASRASAFASVSARSYLLSVISLTAAKIASISTSVFPLFEAEELIAAQSQGS